MSSRSIGLSEALQSYLLDVSLREPPLLARLRAETAPLELANMQISPEQGQFMALLAKLIGARQALEIGVFTGYSSLVMAQTLPEDGKVVACDVSEEWTAIAKRYWAEAGVDHKIDLHLRPAQQTLDALRKDGRDGSFDIAFIDADKVGYRGYYEGALALLRPGGLILLDNMFRAGRVLDPNGSDDDTRAIQALNVFLKTDERVDLSLVPISDGLTLARKR